MAGTVCELESSGVASFFHDFVGWNGWDGQDSVTLGHGSSAAGLNCDRWVSVEVWDDGCKGASLKFESSGAAPDLDC